MTKYIYPRNVFKNKVGALSDVSHIGNSHDSDKLADKRIATDAKNKADGGFNPFLSVGFKEKWTTETAHIHCDGAVLDQSSLEAFAEAHGRYPMPLEKLSGILTPAQMTGQFHRFTNFKPAIKG